MFVVRIKGKNAFQNKFLSFATLELAEDRAVKAANSGQVAEVYTLHTTYSIETNIVKDGKPILTNVVDFDTFPTITV